MILERVVKKERVLVTARDKTPRRSVRLLLCFARRSVPLDARGLNALERVELLSDLRNGDFDVLVGVNLLREGLDLPEVSLVAILDADKEGFLRSETSLIQTIGRCARNVNAKVILFADKVTESMNRAISETERRRALQDKFNKEHNITPESVVRSIKKGIDAEAAARRRANGWLAGEKSGYITREYLDELQKEMLAAADELDFERAASLRDQIEELRDQIGQKKSSFDFSRTRGRKRGRGGTRGGGLVPKPEI